MGYATPLEDLTGIINADKIMDVGAPCGLGRDNEYQSRKSSTRPLTLFERKFSIVVFSVSLFVFIISLFRLAF